MIDSNRPGPAKALWAPVVIAMIAAMFIGFVQPVTPALAASPGQELTVASLATTANPLSHDVAVLWTPVTAAGQSLTLTVSAINVPPNNIAQTFTCVGTTPTTSLSCTTPQGSVVINLTSFTGPLNGTQTLATLPNVQGTAACFQLAVQNGATLVSRSDNMCVAFGYAGFTQLTTAGSPAAQVPGPPNFFEGALNQGGSLLLAWQPIPGATDYEIFSLGTNGIPFFVTGNTATVVPVVQPGATFPLVCGLVAPRLNGVIVGTSNAICGFVGQSSAGVPATSTPTRTGTPPTNTPINTNTALPTNTTVPNTAVPSNTPVPTATVTNTPTGANLSITKTALSASIAQGGVLNYNVVINNTGGTTATGQIVQDVLPAGMTLLSATGNNGFGCGGAVSQPNGTSVFACTNGTIPGNSTSTIQISTLAANPCINGANVINTATLSTAPGAPFATAVTATAGCPTQTPTVTNTVAATATITPIPQVQISKQVDKTTVTPGDTLTYTLTLTNPSNVVTNNLVVRDNLSGSVIYNGGAGLTSGTATVSCSQSGSQLSCTSSPFTGTVVITIPVTVQNPCVGSSPINNTATATQTLNGVNVTSTSNTVATVYTGCPTATPTIAPTSTTAPTGTAGPTGTRTNTPTATSTPAVDLTISKSVSATNVPNGTGQGLTYSIVVQNLGSVSASGITVVDNMGTAFASPQRFQSISASAGSGFSCQPDGNITGFNATGSTVTCTGGTLNPNSAATITLFVSTVACTNQTIDNNVSVTYPGTESNPNNNTSAAGSSCGTSGTSTPTPIPASTNTPLPTATGTPTTAPAGSVSMVKTASITQLDPTVDTFYSYIVTITNSSAGPVNIDFNDPLPCSINAAACNTNVYAPNAVSQNPGNPSFCSGAAAPTASCTTAGHGVRFQSVTATNGLVCASSAGTSGAQGIITCGGTLAGNTSSVITENVSVRGPGNAQAPTGQDIGTPPTGGCAPITNTATLSSPAAPIVINPNASNTITILGCVNTTPPSTSTPIPTAFPTNTPAPTATTGPVPAADIDVIFTDNVTASSVPASANCGGTGDKAATMNGATPSCSGARINVFNDSTTAFTGVVYTVTLTSPSPGDPQAAPAAGVIVGGGVGWACPVAAPNTFTSVWTCTGNLAPKAGGAGTNVPDANPNNSSVIIDLFNSLAANGTQAGNWTWSSTVTCGSPTPCTSGTVSAGNGDGSVLVIADTDPIFASDLDGGGAGASNPTVAQYAPGAGNPGAIGQFVWFNDGPQPIGALTVSGSVAATGTTTISQLTAAPTAGFSGLMTCSATITGANTGTWTCSGAITADNGTQGDNAGGADVNSYAFITITAKGAGVAGNTVVFTPNAPVCTAPGSCATGVVGPANSDGGSTATTPPIVTSTIN